MSGKISFPPLPLPLPPLPLPPEPTSESESSAFLFNRLISSNPISPRNSLTAFLAAFPALPTLSAKLSAPPPASSKLLAKSPAAPPAPCKPLVTFPTAPATPSLLLTFLSNNNCTNSANFAVAQRRALAKAFNIGITAFIIGKKALPIFKAVSFIKALNVDILVLTVSSKVSPYRLVACSKIAINLICCCVWKSNCCQL